MDDETETAVPRKRTSKKGRTAKQATSTKKIPWTFPKNALEDAIRIPKAIEEKNGGNPIPAQDLAYAVGFRQTTDWRFLDLARSASQYGLVSWSGASTPISMTKLGQDVVAPSSASQRAAALLASFRAVKDFEAVEKFYGG